MARTRLLNMGMLAIMLISIMAAGCSNDLSDNTVPSDIRNTRWVGQGTQSNITLDIRANGIYVSGAGPQWDGWCWYGGGPGYGYGCCVFRTSNGRDFSWQYDRQGDTLNVTNSSNPALNGQWKKI